MSSENNYKMIAKVIKDEYLIKNYQRGYRWDIPQIKSLLDDIYSNFKRYYFHDNIDRDVILINANKLKSAISTQYAYCLQPLVVKNDQKTGKYSVIDGQQRLTTIALIVNALKKLCNSEDMPDDKVSIAYEAESKSKSITIDKICDICDNDNNIASVLDGHNETNFNGLEEKCDKLQNIYKGLPNIDAQFMARGYVYIRLYYKTIINQVKKYADDIRNNKEQEKEEYEQDHLCFVYPKFDFDSTPEELDEAVATLLRNVIKYCTTVIWYEPLKNENKDKTEEDIFKNFNSGKIPLTKSELVKALLMNPDNYTKDSNGNIFSEAIKTRQILIASKWDEIEKKLHNDELWHFFPHYDDWHNKTRFDALIDYFVYCEYTDRNKNVPGHEKIFQNNMQNDPEHYTYKLLEKYIKEDLSEAGSSDKKTEKMKKWWKRICDTYSSFEVYISNDKKIIELFHRISLLKWLYEKHFDKITNGNSKEKYLNQMSENYSIFTELAPKRNPEKRSVLNGRIKKEINTLFENKITVLFSAKDENSKHIEIKKDACTDLSKKIRALVYDAKCTVLVQTFLKIFTLYNIERNVSDRTRYPFFSDKEEKWQREHIFAKNTSFSDYKNKTPDEKKKLINDIIGTGWEEYLRFKYEDLLGTSIDSIIKQKQNMIDRLEECLADIEKDPNDTEKINYIFEEVPKEKVNELTADSGARIEFDYDDNNPSWDPNFTILQFLRDNSMGNMCLLIQDINAAVGNKPYFEKKEKVLEKLYEHSFVPMATLMVFSGAYCAEYSTEHWYPCHRKKYLDAMINAVEDYLK